MLRKFFVLLFLLMTFVVLAACGSPPLEVVYEVVYITATPGPSPTITRTPTPSRTPTPTPTPTATALPAELFDDLRDLRLEAPVSAGGAPCGFVDILDFPMDPPHAEQARGGGDFGVFRSRFDKFHAGEDWGGVFGGSNFGAPVYSVGHGIVTYAQPLGWGVDQGVVIIRHAFRDGSTLLSFYGHLDPPSVDLRPGTCVERGEKIGEIGRPRGWPHLHFEMRTHLPDAPGPGYWPVDPRRGGWVPPSQTIWANRMGGSPGIIWALPPEASASVGLGEITGGGWLTLEGDRLVRIDLADGRTLWEQVLEEDQFVDGALLDPTGQWVYTVDQFGYLQQLELSLAEVSAAPVLRWEIDVEGIGRPSLLPLPGGGVLVLMPRTWTAVSAAGEQLWERSAPGAVSDWIQMDETLVLALRGVEGGIWRVDRTGMEMRVAEITGRLAVLDETLFIYDGEGVYRFMAGSEDVELIYALPHAYPRLGDIVVNTAGDLVLAHSDRGDRKVMALSVEGNVLWEGSIAALPSGDPRLVEADGRVYLELWNSTSRENQLQLYAVSEGGEVLRQVFQGGTRTPFPAGAWLEVLSDERLLIRIGGGGMALLDPAQALLEVSETP